MKVNCAHSFATYGNLFKRFKKRIMKVKQAAQGSGDKKDGEDKNHTSEVVEDEEALVNRFSGLYNNQKYSDIVLRVGNNRFYAHKFMLVTVSEVFDAMLNDTHWRESSQQEIHLTEDDHCIPVFEDFLKYIYTGKVSLTTDNVLPILLLADKYSAKVLQESCVAYMLRHIVESPDSNRTLTWYQYAKMTSQRELQNSCLKFILSNFDIILKTSDWLELTKSEIMEFLESSEMVVLSEFALYTEIEKWLKSDHQQGSLYDNLTDLLPYIRFTMITPKLLLQIENSPICQQNSECFAEKLNLAYKHHSLLLDGISTANKGEPFRNYFSDEYQVCTDLSLLNYHSVTKITSRISTRCMVPIQFIPPAQQKCAKKFVSFTVDFYPKGFYTTITLYGSYIGRQTESTYLRILRNQSSLQPMKTEFTLVIYGMKNKVKYVAFTYMGCHTFSKDSNDHTISDVIPVKLLKEEDSNYLVNGNFDAKIFIKVQDIFDAEESSKPTTSGSV